MVVRNGAASRCPFRRRWTFISPSRRPPTARRLSDRHLSALSQLDREHGRKRIVGTVLLDVASSGGALLRMGAERTHRGGLSPWHASQKRWSRRQASTSLNCSTCSSRRQQRS